MSLDTQNPPAQNIVAVSSPQRYPKWLKKIIAVTIAILLLGLLGGAAYEGWYYSKQYEKKLLEIIGNTMDTYPVAFGLEHPPGLYPNGGVLAEKELKEQKPAAVELKTQISGLRPPLFGKMRVIHRRLMQSLDIYLVATIPDSLKIAQSFARTENFRMAMYELMGYLRFPGSKLTVYNESVQNAKTAGDVFFNKVPIDLSETQRQKFEELSVEWSKLGATLVLVASPSPEAEIGNSPSFPTEMMMQKFNQISEFIKQLEELSGNKGLSTPSLQGVIFVTLQESKPLFEQYQKLQEELQKKHRQKEEIPAIKSSFPAEEPISMPKAEIEK